MKAFLAVLSLLLGASVLLAPMASAAEAPPPGAPIKVTAAQVGKDYASNKVVAEHKWDGKYVEFSGTVLSISDGGFSGPSVSFKLPPDLFSQMVCEVTDEEQLNRPNLVEGGQATVRGIVAGDQTIGVVRMHDCVVL